MQTRAPRLPRFGVSVPPSLAMTAAGVDISMGSVKCVELSHAHGHVTLRTHSEVPLPEGVVIDGDIEKPDVVTDIIRSFRVKNRIRYAHAALSEKKSYLYQIIVPADQKNLRDAVEFDLEAHVPLPPSDTIFDFEVVRRERSGTIVSVTAFARRLVEGYEKIFKNAGVVLRSLEVESHALVRAAVPPKDKDRVVMVVDMGKRSTRIAVADHGVVSYTATMDIGGDMLTQALMKRFSLDETKAEEMKNTRGFIMTADNADVVEAVAGTVSVIKDELMRHRSYWDNPTGDDLPRPPIDRMIIAGGNANMIGLSEYLADATGLSVGVANVWTNAFSLDEYIPHMPAHESLEFAPAIGLALKSAFNQTW